MDIKLSTRVQRIKPSPTLAVSALAGQLRAEGRDVIGLGAGEPDFDTPEHIKKAAIEALKRGRTKYTPVDGIPSLKQAVIEKFKRDNDISYTAEQILISVGGKQSSYNLYQALLEVGDEVVIPAPYWVSYPDMVLLADAKPVIVLAGQDQDFKLHPEQLEAAITDRTKLFVLNSPSNPSGAAYTFDELKALGEVLLRYPQVVIATDDMYEHIMFQGHRFVTLLNACPELYDRTVVMNGVSKAYSMTGWRIGYCGGPADLIKAMKKIQSQSTSNPTSISQYAAQAALEGDQDCVTAMCKAFEQRHAYVHEVLNEIEGFECLPSAGTFYSFPNVEKALGLVDGISDDVQFAEYLLDKVGVALVPGSAFGAPGHIRISFATSMENLERAIGRIKSVVNP